METFEDFIRRILEIIFWLLVLTPVLIFPVVALIIPVLPLPFNPYALISDPFSLLPLMFDFMNSDFFRIAVFPGFTLGAVVATVMILFERKFLAKINLRIGPLYAGRFEGVLQPIADLFKLLFKELVIPERADKPMFIAAPLATFAVAAGLLSVIPLSPTSVIARSDFGLLVVFAVLSFFPIIVLVAAWASSNKFSFIGGLRALHQMISFEIPMILSVVGVVVVAGSLNLITIVEAQSRIWFLVPQFIGAACFYICVLAELERIPFDLPEADTEIVAGWLTEYSGMLFGLPMIAVYIKFYALAGFFTTLFLGGWMGPAFLPPEAWFLIKTLVVMALMILPRGANPRVRIDILIRAGWAYLIILAIVNLFIAMGVAYLGVLA